MTQLDIAPALVTSTPALADHGAQTTVAVRHRRGRRLLRSIIREPAYWLSWAIVAVIVLWVVWPTLFTSFDPLETDAVNKLLPPSSVHPFGTDYIGRDLFSRVVHGSALSLQATVIALALAFVVSAVIGLLAGFVGGVLDSGLMRVIDVLLAIPSLLISLVLVTALGFGTLNIAIAVAVGSIASFSRVMRAEVLRVSSSPFVEAARASGLRWWAILTQHVLPHARGPVLALVALEFGGAILSIAALSFLGFGVALPEPEWGSLVAEGRNYLGTAWWLTVLPGVVIVAAVVAANRISRGIGVRRDGFR